MTRGTDQWYGEGALLSSVGTIQCAPVAGAVSPTLLSRVKGYPDSIKSQPVFVRQSEALAHLSASLYERATWAGDGPRHPSTEPQAVSVVSQFFSQGNRLLRSSVSTELRHDKTEVHVIIKAALTVQGTLLAVFERLLLSLKQPPRGQRFVGLGADLLQAEPSPRARSSESELCESRLGSHLEDYASQHAARAAASGLAEPEPLQEQAAVFPACAMEPDCWLIGGEFEDSVFEEGHERRPGPPAPCGAKHCEPQVRGWPCSGPSAAGLTRPPVLGPPFRAARPAERWTGRQRRTLPPGSGPSQPGNRVRPGRLLLSSAHSSSQALVPRGPRPGGMRGAPVELQVAW